MAAALQFWTAGCGALVLSTRLVNGANTTRVGFGPQSLRCDDGAKFALELVEGQASRYGEDGVLQYIQLAIPIFRLSKVMASGGEIESAYGWTALTAPGGLPLRVRIDENRRDPFEFIALRTTKVADSVAYYKSLGLAKLSEETGKRKIQISINSNTIFEDRDATIPDREVGSVLMSYGDAEQTTGLLLLPPQRSRKSLPPDANQAVLRIVGTAAGTESRTSPEGVVSEFMPESDFEAAVRVDGVGRGASVMDA